VPIGAAFAAWGAAIVAIAWLASTRAGARAGVWLAIALLPLPAFVAGGAHWTAVFVVAVLCLFAVFRGGDLARDRSLAGFPRRLRHLANIHDSRLIVAAPPHLERAALVRVLVAGAVVVACLWLIHRGARYDDWRRYALRWYLGGFPLPFAGCIAVDSAITLVAGALGRHVPRAWVDPHLSASLSEFWSHRWNRIVNGVLRDHVFRPLSRHGAVAAMTGAFVASAALHAYLIGVLLGPWAIAAWSAFFLAQPPAMWLERRLGVRRWPTWAGRTWTLGVLALLYPLFVAPVLALIDPR
jgi:hypothetical protein